MGNRMRKSSYSEREAARSRINHLRERATELEIQINEDLFSGARVIASTLVSSNHRILTAGDLPHSLSTRQHKPLRLPVG